MPATAGYHGVTAFKEAYRRYTATAHSNSFPTPRVNLPPLSEQRRIASLTEQTFDIENHSPPALEQHISPTKQPDTILYLAYGSNLSAETFLNRRNIHPLSASNVVVPSLTMTFDLAGLPYLEPCFANTKHRSSSPTPRSDSEKTPLLPSHPAKPPDYHKAHWPKGLVGVVYEVTPADYAHIIATEGGGASYQDILVSCHELLPDDPTVPLYPTSPPFNAHTLYSPALSPGDDPEGPGGHLSRPDPNYAQPSARYLSLITTGAHEHALPAEYISYLDSLRPYTITTSRQRLGAWIFGMIWLPFITLVLGLFKQFADERGRAPEWLVRFAGAIFRGMWMSYDAFFLGLFGDGERTIDNGDDEDTGIRRRPHRLSALVRHSSSADQKARDRYQIV